MVKAQSQVLAQPGWVDTGLSLQGEGDSKPICLDPVHPDTLLFDQYHRAKSINLLDGQITQITDHGLTQCAEEAGFLLEENQNGYLRLNYNGFAEKQIPYKEEFLTIPQDGTAQMYGIEGGSLYYSSDGGSNWEKRGQSLKGKLLAVAAAATNARVVYVVMQGEALPPPPSPAPGYFKTLYKFSIWASSDAGLTWEKRSDNQEEPDSGPCYYKYGDPFLRTLSGRATPVDEVVLVFRYGCSPTGEGEFSSYSIDGGRNFTKLADSYFNYYGPQPASFLGRVSQGLILNKAFSPDGGKTWQDIKPPSQGSFIALPNTPGSLLWYDSKKGDSWYSSDLGKTWKELGKNLVGKILVSSYTPTTLITVEDKTNKIYRLDLPSVDKTQTAPAMSSQLSSNNYYTATQHYLSPLFERYWREKGGLAQFGYPQTEAFREFNPADSKFYMVQYFERNRFEYHPEYRGTDYEVELGLLGNQLTEARRANHDGAFNRFDDMHYPGGAYFAATGHNLRNSFKTYWEQHGGLAIYGYPISEEFYEKNPDDGQTYVVQYFERNRFEYHPANKGTPYEVELGLLGNTLLKQKGWL